MSAASTPVATPFGRTVAAHSVGWLVAANLVGLWLGLCLVFPSVGNLIAPFTYGRWSPLHLEWQLYGWCTLPIIGALLAWYLDAQHPRAARHAGIALAAWSGALALGGVAWLGGNTSGKLFLDWHGWTRPLLPLAMHVLWAFLAVHTWWRWRGLSRDARIGRITLLALLLVVPSILFWSMSPTVHPPVNPDSGGATGASLLGSTLGIVTICFLLPSLLGLRAIASHRWFIAAVVVSWSVFGFLDRGDISHHTAGHIAALAVLLAWIPLLPLYARRHAWPERAGPWLIAAGAWWAVLVASGWITYLPQVSEALKFTHALVGHAHLAMAGFLTSVNGAILVVLTGRGSPRVAFWLWQSGCAVFVVVMLVLGWTEVDRLAELYRSETWTQVLLAMRLAAGAAMTLASLLWWRAILHR